MRREIIDWTEKEIKKWSIKLSDQYSGFNREIDWSVKKKKSHLFEEASWVLADLGKAWDDVVEVEIAESGMVSTLSLHLSQEKVPAVDWRQDILLLPAEKSKEKHIYYYS